MMPRPHLAGPGPIREIFSFDSSYIDCKRFPPRCQWSSSRLAGLLCRSELGPSTFSGTTGCWWLRRGQSAL